MKMLLGEISSYKAIVIATYLKKAYPHIEIFTYDFRKHTRYIRTKFSDKHFVVENPSINLYLNNLSQLIKVHSIDFFSPVHSDYISEILKHKSLFGQSLSYLGDYNDYERLHNKDTLIKIANNIGIRIPQNYRNIEEAKIPFIGKPKIGSSANGVFYCFKEEDKGKLITKQLDNYLFQEYIKGIGCGYSIYAKGGQIQTGYGHIRLAEYPISGGSSVYRDTFFKKEMETIVQRILKEVQWTGFAMFEFKLTPRNEIVLIEVNPRIWGSINQGLQNGINYFEPILGKSKICDSNKKNIKTYLSPYIYITLIEYIFKGNFKPLKTFIKNTKYNKADVNIFDDLKGWLSIIIRKFL